MFKDYAFRGFPPCPDPFLECQQEQLDIFQAALRLDKVDCKVHEMLARRKPAKRIIFI